MDGVEEGETLIEAAIRECGEEIGNGFEIGNNDLNKVLEFNIPATSNPDLTINMNVFLSSKKIDVDLISNDEILEFRWFNIKEDYSVLSESISKKFIPYAIENNIMY